MRDIQMVLERWGAWAASDSSGVDYSPIAAGFKGLLPYTSKTRQACSDSDALIIEGCLARLKQKKPDEHSLLVAHYLYRIWAAVRPTTSRSPAARSGASVTSPRMTRPTISKPTR